MDRKAEICQLMGLSPREVIDRAGARLAVCDDLDALHRRFARDVAAELEERNGRALPTRLILPVGPAGQYPYLVDSIHGRGISLDRCWLFFMDEYCGEDGRAIGIDHPLSFRDVAQQLFLQELDPAAGLDPDRIFFPSERNIDRLDATIEEIGGIDTCYGGIGIHGHVAFNEPEPGISEKGSRLVDLNDFTVTINAVRARVGGNLETFPRRAFTIGMKQILAARRIRLYCRNGTPYDWANTVLRVALFGASGDDYPVTHVRNHPDCVITTDWDTLQSPENLI